EKSVVYNEYEDRIYIIFTHPNKKSKECQLEYHNYTTSSLYYENKPLLCNKCDIYCDQQVFYCQNCNYKLCLYCCIDIQVDEKQKKKLRELIIKRNMIMEEYRPSSSYKVGNGSQNILSI